MKLAGLNWKPALQLLDILKTTRLRDFYAVVSFKVAGFLQYVVRHGPKCIEIWFGERESSTCEPRYRVARCCLLVRPGYRKDWYYPTQCPVSVVFWTLWSDVCKKKCYKGFCITRSVILFFYKLVQTTNSWLRPKTYSAQTTFICFVKHSRTNNAKPLLMCQNLIALPRFYHEQLLP